MPNGVLGDHHGNKHWDKWDHIGGLHIPLPGVCVRVSGQLRSKSDSEDETVDMAGRRRRSPGAQG